MAGYSLAVQFKEYARYDYHTYEDTSKPPDYISGKFTELYKFIPKRSSARAIKNKFIYVFQKTSGGSAYINREMKADDQGKLEIYDINNWERETDRQVKSRNHERIYFDEKSIKNGSKYYFCISQIQWSKERIRTIVNQLSAGYCKRLTPLPIHKDYLSGYTDEQKSAVEYSEDYLATVYLIDYMEYVYKALKNGEEITYLSPSLINEFYNKKKAYDSWLADPDDKEKKGNGEKFERAKLKAVNDAIWTLAGLGTKFWDLTRMSYMADIANKILTLPYRPLSHTYGIVEQWKRFKKHNPYVQKLRELDERKYGNIALPPDYHMWTNAEAWLVNYKKDERERYNAWQNIGKLIVKWIAQGEFIAMQHDYLYANEEEEVEEIKDITGNILMNIVDSNDGKKYIDSIVYNTKNDLDMLKELYRDEIDSIYTPNKTELSRDEQIKLLKMAESAKKEINILTTTFFVARKLEIGIIKMLEGISSVLPDKDITFSHLFRYTPLEELLSLFEENAKVNTIDTIFEHLPDKRYGMDFVSVKSDAFNSGYYKQKYVNVNGWKNKVRSRLSKSLEKKGIDAIVDFELRTINNEEYCVAVARRAANQAEFDRSLSLRIRQNGNEINIEGVLKKEKKLKKWLNNDLLNDLVLGVEVLNVLFAFSELFNNSSEFEVQMDLLNLTSAIMDIGASVMDRMAKKAISKLYCKVYTASSLALGLISGGIEAYISWRFAKECAKVGDTDAQQAYMLAAAGGISVAVGSLVSLATLIVGGSAIGGPIGTVLVVAGVVMQITGTIIAAIVSQDDFQEWINFCYWGGMAENGGDKVPSYSPVPLKDWKDDLNVQLEAYYFLLFGFKTEIKVWTDMHLGYWKECAKLSLIITPNCICEKSLVFVSLWLEDDRGSKEILVQDKIIAINEVMLNSSERSAPDNAKKAIIRDKGYIIPDIIRSNTGRIEKIMLSWFDPAFKDSVAEHWFYYDKELKMNNGIEKEDFRTHLVSEGKKLKAEIYIDYNGTGQIIIPKKTDDGEIKKLIIENSITEYYID